MSYCINLDLDLKSICRICLEKVNEFTDLFSETAESLEILKKISECFQIILDSEKYLPCVICTKCIEELDNANSFRIKCVSINERFKDYCEKLLKNSSEKEVKSSYLHHQITEFTEDTQSEHIEEEKIESNELFTSEADHFSNFKCKMCNKELKSMKSLLKHVACMHENRRHVGKVSGFGSDRRYHCTTCAYSTPHSQTLVNHMRKHNRERPYTCECGKSFTQASSLAAHRKTHSPTTYFTCSQCGKQFKHAFSLKTHLRVHENGIFNCSICTKVLKSKQTLSAHMKRHYHIYNYNCEDCGDTFVTTSELLNHRKKHGVEKNIVCHICDYATTTKKSLVVHLKRHIGDKAYKCMFCDKSFYTPGDLRRHMRVHTREKPFACQTCAQKFTCSSSLNKHMLNVHGIQFKWGEVKWKEARTKKLSIEEIK